MITKHRTGGQWGEPTAQIEEEHIDSITNPDPRVNFRECAECCQLTEKVLQRPFVVVRILGIDFVSDFLIHLSTT